MSYLLDSPYEGAKLGTGGCIGLLAYTRPRLAAKVVAAGALLTAPWLGLMAVQVNRWSNLAGMRSKCVHWLACRYTMICAYCTLQTAHVETCLLAERLVQVSEQVDQWRQNEAVEKDFQPAEMQSDTLQ